MSDPIERALHDVYPFISAKHNLKGVASGKTVLITGAGGGIGRAIALHFAEAGAKSIVVGGRTLSSLNETKEQVESQFPSCSVHPITIDVTSTESVDTFFSQVPFVPDVLINNAGISVSAKHIADSDPEAWWRNFEVNVKGVFLCTRKYLQTLAGEPGTVITVSSSVCDVTHKNMSSYGTTKLAVNRFTEILHTEYAEQGVKAYAFHPGGISSTGMGSRAPAQYAPYLCDTVDLAAGMALYLSSDRAEYLRGRFVYGAWDMERVEAMKDEIVADDLLVHRLKLGDKLSGTIVLPWGERR